jgi:hypothetical protein
MEKIKLNGAVEALARVLCRGAGWPAGEVTVRVVTSATKKVVDVEGPARHAFNGVSSPSSVLTLDFGPAGLEGAFVYAMETYGRPRRDWGPEVVELFREEFRSGRPAPGEPSRVEVYPLGGCDF